MNEKKNLKNIIQLKLISLLKKCIYFILNEVFDKIKTRTFVKNIINNIFNDIISQYDNWTIL